jgi:IS30 family transposase
MDLLEGQRSRIAVLSAIERKTRYVRLRLLKSHKPAHVVNQASEALKGFRIKTITNDNGIEFQNHKQLAKRTGAQIYFTNPYSSWERGSIENMNGLIRQYFPKGESLKKVSKEKLEALQNTLNNRPRAVLNFRTPEELMFHKKKRLFLRKPPIYEET